MINLLTVLLISSSAFSQEDSALPPAMMDEDSSFDSLDDELPVPVLDNSNLQPPAPLSSQGGGEPHENPPMETKIIPLPSPIVQEKVPTRSEKKLTSRKKGRKKKKGRVLSPEASDFARELHFHQIYMQYNQTPLSEQEWTSLTKERKNESYHVQSGDTLWGISETLFGDGAYWSKVWAVNSNITNPHEILPEAIINFYPGSMNEAPIIALDKSSKEKVKNEKLAKNLLPSVPISESSLPPPQRVYRPNTHLPPSLPSWKMELLPVNTDVVIVDLHPQAEVPGLLYLDHFVTESAMVAKGTIVETETTDKIASDLQYVYVRLDSPNEKKFSVVRKLGVVNDPDHLMSGVDLYEVQGEIEVIGSVDVGKKLYRAIVRKTVNPISVGGLLIAGSVPRYNMTAQGEKQNIETTIIGGASNTQREIYATQSLVFLNKGSAAGLSPQVLLPVLANPQVRKKDSVVNRMMRQIGLLKVLKVTPKYATAVVIWANEELRTGDKTGPFGTIASKIEDISAGENPTAQYDEHGVDLGGEVTTESTSEEAF